MNLGVKTYQTVKGGKNKILADIFGTQGGLGKKGRSESMNKGATGWKSSEK